MVDIISAVVATNITFSLSRTTCRNSITSCSALKSKGFYRQVAIVRITNPQTFMPFVILVPLLIKVIQGTVTCHVQIFFFFWLIKVIQINFRISKGFHRQVPIVRITNTQTVMHFVILVSLLTKVIQETATYHAIIVVYAFFQICIY